MILKDALRHYRNNFTTVLGFALLLVFVIVFTQIANNVVSSGSVFLDYNFLKGDLLMFFVQLLAMGVFLFLYSVFVVLIVFAVRKDMSAVRIHYYLTEKVQKFALKLFVFLLLFSIASMLAIAFLINLGIAPELINIALLLLAVLCLFLPQSLVIDETNVVTSVIANLEFMKKNPKGALSVLVVGTVLVALLPLLEYALDLLFLYGSYVSLLITLLFIIPYIEIMKSQLYMHKFELVKQYHREIKPKEPVKELASLEGA